MNVEEISTVIEAAIEYFNPVIEAVDDKEQTRLLLKQIGYDIPNSDNLFKELLPLIDSFFQTIDVLDKQIEEDKLEMTLVNFKKLLQLVRDITKEISTFEQKLNASLPGSAVILANDVTETFGKRITDFLTITFLQNRLPVLKSTLSLFGIIEEEFINSSASSFEVPYYKKTIHWNELPSLINNPLGQLEMALFHDNLFLFEKLAFLLSKVAISLGLYSDYRTPDEEIFSLLNGTNDNVSSEEFVDEIESLRIPLLYSINSDVFLEIYPILDLDNGEISGFAMAIKFGIGNEFALGEVTRLIVQNSSSLNNGLGIMFMDDGNVQFLNNIFVPDSSSIANQTQFTCRFNVVYGDQQRASELLKFSALGIGQFAIGSFDLSFGLNKDNNTSLYIETILRDCQFLLNLEEADSFATKIGADTIKGIFDLGIGLSNENGFYFKGNTRLTLNYPVHIQAGAIRVKSIAVELLPKSDEIPLTIGGALETNFGPFKIILENIGTRAKFKTSENRNGNFGLFDLTMAFRPPTGVGLKIDASAVQGGGFLRFDPDKEEYSGVLELTIKEKIALKAIGIITTKLPNGQEGYSLLLLISAEFTPIQLGFGFTLNGVGGLIAVHRGMDLVAIRLGVQNKTLDHILFPKDPLANAPQIIASLDSVFPIAEDNYSFGLMALIGWGVPTLLEVELGLLISFPANDIAVVGTLSTTLPDKKTPLLILNVAFAGTLSFENKYLYFDARIDKSSRLLSFALSGDMALRVLWGEEPNFVLTVGGFHPDFQVPEKLGLEGLQRITLNLLADDNPRLLLKCYFALTSNTAQFGATIDFFFKKSKFKVVGFFYIHALFQFSPFYFIIALGATLDVKLGSKSVLSVGVEGSLEGPTPWKAKGKGKFKIWWVKYSVSFNKTWGESKDTSLPNIAVFPELKRALEDDRNWAALLPKHATLASLRELDDPTDPDTEKQDRLTLHPMASLSLIQHVVPLNINIEKFGSQKPADFKKFSLSFETGGQELDTVVAKDFFAPAQFFALSKEEKISRKSYEKYPAGLRSDADKLQANFKRNKEVEYEFELIDSIEAPPSRGIAYEPATHLIHWNKGNAIAQSQLGKQVQLEALVTGKKITYSEEEFVIVKQDDLTPIADIAPATEFEIQKTLDDLIQKEPQLQDQYITVPAYEIF
ncbi:MAG: DUF6603 domain-containing protein [Flavobacteriaceae bacterium]